MRSYLPHSRWNLLAAAGLLFAFLGPLLPAFAQGGCNPVITIDSPRPNATVQGMTTFGGWAVDQNAQSGSGITSVQIVADGLLGSGGTVVGTATQVARPDVDAALGRTGSFGFTLNADLSKLPPGSHTFYVYATTSCGPSYASVPVMVQAGGTGSILLNVDVPSNGATVPNGISLTIGGWTSGSSVEVDLDGPTGQGKLIGTTAVNGPRPDVVQVTGRQDLANSGFSLSWTPTGVPNGTHALFVYAFAGSASTSQQIQIMVTGGPNRPAGGPYPPGANYYAPGNYFTGQTTNCNPDFPNYNYLYPSNTPCSGGSLCNPFFPNESTLYTNNVPCNGTYPGGAPYYGYSGNCYNYYPPIATSYSNTCTAPSTTYNGACNPYFPTIETAYPNNVPCPPSTTIGCNPAIGPVYGSTVPCTGTGGPLPPPSNVNAGQTRPGTVTINWNAVAGATDYTVLQSSTAGGQYTFVTEINGSSTIVSGLPNGTYYFAVVANSSQGPSAPAPANPVTVSF